MKIVFGTLPYYPTRDSGKGVDRISYYILRRIRDLGLDYTLLGWRINTHSRIGRVFLRLTRYPNFAKSRGDVYLATESYSGYLFNLFKKRPNLLIIHDLNPFGGFHNAYDSLFSRISRTITRFRYRKSILGSDVIIVPFEFTKTRLLKLFYIEPSKIKVVPYGIDLPDGFATNNNYISLSRSGIKRLLFIGGTNPLDRGSDVAIRVLSYILKYQKDIHLVISCDKRHWKQINAQASGLKIEKNIELISFIPESQLREVFLSCDIFVYPSRIGFSLLVLQAMSFGIPVVTSDKLDLPEFLHDYGQYYPLTSLVTMAEAIIKILHDESFRSFLIGKGYEICKSHTADKMSSSILEIAKQLPRSTDKYLEYSN